MQVVETEAMDDEAIVNEEEGNESVSSTSLALAVGAGEKATSASASKKPPVTVSATTNRSEGSESSQIYRPRSPNTLEHVLALHTAQRMKPRSSSPKQKQKQPKLVHGVSIPSQRRWLYYWSLLLAGEGPSGFWELNQTGDDSAQKTATASHMLQAKHPKRFVRLRDLTVRMRHTDSVTMRLLAFASKVVDNAHGALHHHHSHHTNDVPNNDKTTANSNEQNVHGDIKSETHKRRSLVWASLARYDDAFVETLERWERHTRSGDGDLGKRKVGSEIMTLNDVRGQVREEQLRNIFEGGRWDRKKMVRSFARLGVAQKHKRNDEVEESKAEVGTADTAVLLFILTPLLLSWNGRMPNLRCTNSRLSHSRTQNERRIPFHFREVKLIQHILLLLQCQDLDLRQK